MSAPGQAGNAQQEDYADKGKVSHHLLSFPPPSWKDILLMVAMSGLDAIEKKVGQQSGHPIDTNKMRSTNEKITDKAREVFEKATGKHVPDKMSN
jgi:hypothetical protein